MAIRFDIVIPDYLIKKIADADNKLKQLGETADETQKAVNNAFKQMINGDLDAFIKKLQTANAEIANLGNKNATKKNGIAEIGEQASHSVDEINKLINAFSKLIEENEKLRQQQLSSRGITIAQEGQLTKKETAVNYKSLTNDVNELRNKEMERGRELTRQNKENIANHKIYSEELKRTTNQRIAEERKASAEIKILNKEEIESWKIASNEKIARQKDESRKRIAAQKQTTNEIIAQMQRETRFRIQEANRIAKLTQTPTTITRKDVGKIIDVSRNATSINQMQTAIKNPEKAKRDLDTTDKKYDKTIKAINKEIENQKQRLKELGVQMDNYKSKSSNLLNISEQLTRRLALVFSVSQVTGYVKKLASVRGEFELQQKSLAAIIQNKDKANEIFDKVTKLAVQSPFQLKELVTYTKQLAAYKIETGKLYDNVKMLADISSGVGVDMSRLVLAYGQVASANYLRGTELRQFSEAGINVLGGLADYFTELYGRVVGVGEVFDMVSRRMVSFADVEEVLRRTTEAGGEFYNMQAIQAQTLKGQISNLKDSIDIMLNEIGESQEGKLKNSVALVRDLVENWRMFASVLQDVSVALVIKGGVDLYKGFKVAKDDLGSFIEEAKGLPKVAASIKKMFFDIQKAIVAHPYITLVAAIAAVGKALWDWNKAVEAQNKVYEKNSVVLSNEIDRLTKVSNKYREYSAEIITAEAAMQKAKDENNQEEYNKALNEVNILQKEQLTILEQLKKEYPDIYNNLNSEKVSWQELAIEIEKANEAKLTQLALNQGKKGSFLGGDSEGENINDVQDLLNEYYKLLQDAQSELATVNSNLKLNFYEGIIDETQLKKAKGLLDELNNSIANGEDINIIKQKEKAFREYTESIGLEYNDLHGAIKDAYQKWYVDIKNIAGRFIDLEDNWENNIDTYKVAWIEAWRELGEVDTSTEAGKQVAKKYIDSMLSQLESEDKNVQNRFKNWLEGILHTDFDFKIEGDENGGDSKERKIAWLEAVEDELNAAKAKIPKLTDEVTKEILQKTEGTDLDIGEGFQFMLPDVKDADSKLLDYNEYIKQFKQQWEKIKSLQDKANTKGQALFSKEAVSDINITAKAYEDAARALGILDSKTKNADEKYSEQIRVLKELHKSYIDLNDIFDKTTSKQGAIEKFSDAFKEAFNVDIDTFWEGLKDKEGLQLDFTTEEGIVAAFDKLIKSIPDQKKRVQAELAKAEFIMEYRIQAKKDADQQLKDDVQKFFDDYEMKIELDKLGISGDAANALFGIESMDLDKLREQLTLKKGEFIGRGMEKEYKAFQDKLTEMEIKAQQERLKKYLGNIRDNISDRAKLKIEELQKLKEIEDSFVAKEGASEEEKQAIETAKKLAIEGLKESTQQQLQKMDWEDFQKSDYFISMFDDLDNASSMAINSMITQLENYKDQWTDMPLDDMKKVIDLINKLKDAADEKITNPFYAAKKTEREIAEYGRSKSESESDFETFTDMSNYEEEQARLYEQALIAKTKILTVEEQEQMLGQENMHLLSMSSEELAQQRDYHKGLSKDYKNQASLAQQQLQRYAKLTNQYEKQAQVLADIRGTFNNLVGAATELGEALDMDEISKMWTEIGGNVFDTGLAIAEGVLGLKAQKLELEDGATAAEMFGYKMNMALGIIGYIVMAIQLVAKIITAINEAHDNELQKQIERDAEAVELLQKRYEKLEEAIDNAMSFGEYQKKFDEAKSNLEEQIRLTERMIALEEDKKKTDKDAIKGYKDEIEDYNEQLKEMEEQRIEDMGGFGSQEAIKDAAEDFIDAWAEAYNETGDGLDALKGKWDEYFNNLLKKQMMMKVASKYMEKVLEEINTAIKDDILTGEEMDRLKTIKDESSEQLNAIMKQLAEQMSWEGGLGGGSELEGLSESIQGVTEVTAQALEAILNSMRFYVIDNNTQQKRLVEIMESWETPTSPILAELKRQTGYLLSIESLFNSVIDRSGSPAVRIR